MINKIQNKQRLKCVPFPKLFLRKNGIVFFSNARHRLNIDNTRIMQVGKTLYVNDKNRFIIITNIKEICYIENCLYFTGCGKVIIQYNCTDIYRYFNIEIQSNHFDLNELKQKAILDLLINMFDISNSKDFLRYLKIITKVFMVKVTKTELTIKQNKLKLPFRVIYRLNKVKKHICVNEK